MALQVEYAIHILGDLHHDTTRNELSYGSLPEMDAQRMNGGYKVDDTYHQNTLDRSGERGKVKRAGMILFPSIRATLEMLV